MVTVMLAIVMMTLKQDEKTARMMMMMMMMMPTFRSVVKTVTVLGWMVAFAASRRCGVVKAKIGKQSRRLIECLRQISDFMCWCGGSRESALKPRHRDPPKRTRDGQPGTWGVPKEETSTRATLFGRLSRLKDEDITHLEPPWENVRLSGPG
ncbi:ML2 [Symbiodinium sp. CCMP2592]|nr:ML2 [Symbiodinium sp. CCMP2592]